MLNCKNIILIGFMGAGKSSVAIEIAKNLQLKFVSTDNLIEKSTKLKIKEFFEQYGEISFREKEIDTIKNLKTNNSIIDTGGGIVLNKINIDRLKLFGKIIFLNCSFQEITKRLKNDKSRPLFQDIQKAKEIFDFRIHLYKQYADIEIDVTNKSIQHISQEIINKLNLNSND